MVRPVRVRERSATLTRAELDAVLEPRTVTVNETRSGDGSFAAPDTFVSGYRRVVTYEPVDGDRFAVRQRVELTDGGDTGFWGHLVGPLLVGHLARIGPDTHVPFWFPPDQLDQRAVVALSRLATLGFVLGYTTILISQTITYAAEEFGANKSAQGIALASVRADVLIALPLAFLADRRGRRWLAVNGTIAACALSAAGALAPNLLGLTMAQVFARGATNACLVITGVMLAEEMPAGARAWATSLVTMAGAVGGGLCVLLLPVADISRGSWRALYVLPLVFIPLVARAARDLRETHRYEVHAQRQRPAHLWQVFLTHRGRFLLIAGSGLLLALFTTPASQFQNEFLRTERHFNGAEISLFVTLTSIPGAIGIFVGGRLAERGRRAVGAFAIFVGSAATVLQFHSYGALLYAWSIVASIVGAAAVPALAVYGAELFPTEARGAANGGIGFASRVGSVIGLVVAGQLGDRIGLSRAFTYLAVGPLLLTVLILVAYPETAHRELEDLNPEDAP
jgi:MFS family permease